MGIGGSTSSNKTERKLEDQLPQQERYYGLQNFGNTCYCNSVLQSLYFVRPLRQQLLSYMNHKKQARDSQSDDSLLDALGELFVAISTQRRQVGYLSPQRFVGKLRDENEIFQGYMQQDAHEFLNFMLNNMADTLIDEEKARRKKLQAEAARRRRQQQLAAQAANPKLPEGGASHQGGSPPRKQVKRGRAGSVQKKSTGERLSVNSTTSDHSAFSNSEQTLQGSDSPGWQEPPARNAAMGATQELPPQGGQGAASVSTPTPTPPSSKNGRPAEKAEKPQAEGGSKPGAGDADGGGDGEEEEEEMATTWIHDIFGGVLTSETKCLCCEAVTNRDEPFFELSLEVERNTSVSACLRAFSQTETLRRGNKFHCGACFSLQEAEKRIKVKRLPTVLVLHLKRFKYIERLQRFTKISYRVNFPFVLKVPNTTEDAEEDADNTMYQLVAVVVHIGSGPSHGHYVSIVKSHGKWILFDDESVEVVDEGVICQCFGSYQDSAASSETGYLLFYESSDVDGCTDQQ